MKSTDEIKNNNFKNGCLGCFGIIAIIVMIIVAISLFGDDEKATSKKEPIVLENFEESRAIIMAASNGVIKNIQYNGDDGKYVHFYVFVDEVTWANSNDSQKSSFSATIANLIRSKYNQEDTFVNIMSATNKDFLATEKVFSGGWDIKR